ncbi:ogr/Delta-like zinc finger family protein [Kluyvera intermedia]|uniref:ogr/Delta-like zinc finger family protein n=1 Tax=Kluyvera intermedia TaxID=61648 RepID=UPI0034A4AF33
MLGSGSHTSTNCYLTEQTKEVYYQCQNIDCSSTFKTRKSIGHVIRRPSPPETIPAPPPPQRRTLNRYSGNNCLH